MLVLFNKRSIYIFWTLKSFLIYRCPNCHDNPHSSLKTSMGTQLVKRPLEVFAIDFTVLELTDGRENVLIMTDVFTKYTWAVPTRD